jgi:hypothetical protein
MFKVISVDSGRSFVKSFCPRHSNQVFQSVIAPGEANFNLTVETKPGDLWVEYNKDNWFIGDFAIRQRPNKLMSDRDPDKCNQQNILLTLAAASLYARNENIVLLVNVPALDYSAQKRYLQSALKGQYKIIHKAGDMSGKASEFDVIEVRAFPEGESAYFGAAYDLDLNLANPDLVNYPSLVVDMGDETTNYISMNPGGEPLDDASGTLKLGVHEVYNDVQKWLSRQGAIINIPQLTRNVIYNLPVFNGGSQIRYGEYLVKKYSEFEANVYSQLNTLLTLKQYRNIVFVGGSVTPLKPMLQERYKFLQTYFTAGSQMLNCYGQYILYQLTK